VRLLDMGMDPFNFADALLGVDGEDEFAIYFAPVGKIKG
jgi:hypothetical protein